MGLGTLRGDAAAVGLAVPEPSPAAVADSPYLTSSWPPGGAPPTGRDVMQTPDPPRSRALAGEPVDSDVDLRVGRQPRRRSGDVALLLAVSLGGAAGAGTRYLLGLALPQQAGTFPATTFGINVVGSALIGILMVLVTDVWTRRRLVRPFLGTGFLGGFTTFSTFAVDIETLLGNGHTGPAIVYLVATPVAAVLAVWATAAATRRMTTWRTR